jgi:hypothetical protein
MRRRLIAGVMGSMLMLGGTFGYAADPVGTGTLSRTSGWVPAGTNLTVTATPDAQSSTFKNWTGDLTGTTVDGSNISFMVTGPRSLTATFLINQYSVEFLLGGKGTASGSTNQLVKHGMAATDPNVTADTGYNFDRWDADFSAVTSALTIHALYTTNEYTLTFDSSGGSAVASITQLYTTDVTAPDNPTKTGYSFAGWNPPVPATMPNVNQTHIAQWTTNQYQLIIISEHGSATPSGTNTYDYGTSIDFAVAGSPVIITNDSKFDATGWVGTGSVGNGTGTNGNFVIEQNSTITWQWSTNYWIELGTAGE